MAKQTRTTKAMPKVEWKFPLNKQNFLWIAIALGVILLGYALMATGISEEPAAINGKWNNPMAVVVAPVLLIIGYCVLIPYALLKRFDKAPEQVNVGE